MNACIHHPNVQAGFHCMKHNIYLCDQCLECRDPEIHCKYRPACAIWFMVKRGGDSIDRNNNKS